VLDGGAHVGSHTIGLAGRLTRGKVLAVEANAASFVDGLLASRYAQHFYTNEERAQIRTRWVRA
jgi:hypothetical protein